MSAAFPIDTVLQGEYKANMHSAAAIRMQVESALAKRVPSALTPVQRQVRPTQPIGIPAIDGLIGGFPLGAITELTGPDGSGRTSLAMTFLATVTRQGGVCAWIDASDTLHGESAAATGVDLSRLLWVRCGVRASSERSDYAFTLPKKYIVPGAVKRGLHGGGFGPHPRTETRGMSDAMGELFLDPQKIVPHETAPTRAIALSPSDRKGKGAATSRPWTRIEQALKATDLVLQAGGFTAVVIDLAGIAPEHVSRIESSVWFRYRAAVERSQMSFVLLTKHPCAKSAGELLLRLRPYESTKKEGTFFSGTEYQIEVERRRFADNVVTQKKPPQSTITWKTSPTWVCR